LLLGDDGGDGEWDRPMITGPSPPQAASSQQPAHSSTVITGGGVIEGESDRDPLDARAIGDRDRDRDGNGGVLDLDRWAAGSGKVRSGSGS